MKTCKWCGKRFKLGKQKNQKYCSKSCKGKKYRKSEKFIYDHLNNGQIGAMNELLVCTELIRKGFDVFRSVCPTCFCDVIAIKKNKILRVEIRTGSKNESTGTLMFPTKEKHRDKIDLFAIVVGKKIYYLDNEYEKKKLPS